MTGAVFAMAGGAVATPPLSAAPDRLSVSALYECYGTTGSCIAAANITTDTVTISSTGGTGAGPTYSWAKVSGDTFTITASTSAATAFSASVNRGTAKTAVYRCTVTRGVATYDVDVNVLAVYTYANDTDPPIGPEP